MANPQRAPARRSNETARQPQLAPLPPEEQKRQGFVLKRFEFCLRKQTATSPPWRWP